MGQMEHRDFLRAATEIGAHGDNDTLPFDHDTRFVKSASRSLAHIATELYNKLSEKTPAEAKKEIWKYDPFSERLLVASGPSGFRTTTKIHPFWNIYLNGLSIGISRIIASARSPKALSYRFIDSDDSVEIFEKESSWRNFRATCSEAARNHDDDSIVIQTDISSFYERISHHHIENLLSGIAGDNCASQVNAILSRFSSGRSFSLPIGGQSSRILAEAFMMPIDQALDRKQINWFRYVDDYVIIAPNIQSAHESLAFLSKQLAIYGLSLNRTKTTILRAAHFAEFIDSQLGSNDPDVEALREIDLYFDPYSDSPIEDYENLRATVESLDVQRLLSLELEKSVPDNFLVAQIGRTLELHTPAVSLDLARTLLSESSLRSFRASWSTIMRGISHLRAHENYTQIHGPIDIIIDQVISHSRHLMMNEGSQLHFLRTLRFSYSSTRYAFVWNLFENTDSETVKRGCLECIGGWSRPGDLSAIANRWTGMHQEVRRSAWLASKSFGIEGREFRRQRHPSLITGGRLGFEGNDAETFATAFCRWAENEQ